MLRFFRSSNIIVIIAVIVIGILTWLGAFAAEEVTAISFGYGDIIINLPEWHLWLFGLILFLASAVILTSVNERLRLIDSYSYLPVLCFVLIIGGVPEIHKFNSVIIANGLLIIVFTILVESFGSERLSYSFFTASALISVATFFFQYMFVYMLVVWIVIALWRPGYWREWVFSILGFALPFYFAFCWIFLTKDDLSLFYELFSTQQTGVNALSINNIIFFVLIITLVIVASGYTLRYISSKKIVIRTGYYLLLFIAAITAGLTLIVPETIYHSWYLAAFPMSFIFSCFLANVRSKFLGTIVLTVLFTGVIVVQIAFLS